MEEDRRCCIAVGGHEIQDGMLMKRNTACSGSQGKDPKKGWG